MGNQYVKTFSLAKGFRTLGVISAAGGTIIDGIGLYNYYNPTANNINSQVSPTKFGIDGTMTAVGIWGGPIGAGAATVYFGLDAFYPGGAAGYGADVGQALENSGAPIIFTP